MYNPSTRPAEPDPTDGSATAGASVTPASRAASIAAPSNVPRTTTGAVLSSVSSTPSRQATTGMPSAAIFPRRASNRSATADAGGLETTTITSADRSSTSRSRASSVITPPTAAERSRPPTPISAAFPTPARSSRHDTSCAPVPEAATMPTGPGRSTFANPSGTPSSTAVPQSGPIISRRRRAASAFSRTSSSTGTLSEKHITCRPRRSACSATSAAYVPGTETVTTVVPGRSARPSAIVCGRASAVGDAPASVFDNAVAAKASASSTAAGSAPFTVINRSSGPAATPSGSMSDSTSRRRFAGVAITTPARTTCSRCCSLDANASSATESR